MPRGRMKRKDTSTIATSYKYAIQPVGALPNAVWLVAKAMNGLWNKLVEAHDAMLDSLPENAAPDDWRAAYVRFLDGVSKAAAEKKGIPAVPPNTTTAYLITRDYGDELNLEFSQKWAVYERFKTAIQNFRNPKMNAGKPRPHHGLKFINLPFRCETGGVETAWVQRPDNRIYVRLVDQAIYQGKHSEAKHYYGSRGHFDIRNPQTGEMERVSFTIPLHRPMPSDTIIKSMSLVGEHLGALGWRWGFAFTVNHQPVIQSTPTTGRSVGIDLGWRVRGESLRIATLWDGARATEILLPLDLSSANDRRLQRRIRHNGGEYEHTRHLRGIWILQERLDTAKDEAKQSLASVRRENLPEAAVRSLNALQKMGRAGLRRLRWALSEAGITLDCLEEWHAIDERLSKRIRKAQLDWEQSKLATYDQLGDWIARHYDYAVIEKMSLRELAEEETSAYDGALHQARKFRQAAGLYKLRLILKRNFAKYGKAENLVEVSAVDTTRKHHSGTGTAQPSPELIVRYTGGQIEDQDINAAINLWQKLPYEARAAPTSPAAVDRSQLTRVVMPISALKSAAN